MSKPENTPAGPSGPTTPTQLPPLLAGRGKGGGQHPTRKSVPARRLAGPLHAAPPPGLPTEVRPPTNDEESALGRSVADPGPAPAPETGWRPAGSVPHAGIDSLLPGRAFGLPHAADRTSAAHQNGDLEVFSLRQHPDGTLELVDNLPVDYSVVREIRDALGQQLIGEHGLVPIETGAGIIDDQVRAWHQSRIGRGERPLTDGERRLLRKAVEDAVYKMGRLQPLLELDGLSDIIIRGTRPVRLHFVTGPVATCAPIADTDEDLIADIRSWASQAAEERPFDRAHPRLALALPGGLRLDANAWYVPWPTVSIRRHPLIDIDLDDVYELGMIDDGMRMLLRAAIRGGKTIVVSGMMKAGKTLLIRAILNELDPAVPIATIETEFELLLHDLPHRHYEVWPAQELAGGEGSGAGKVTVSELIPNSLRQSVDVIVVGEVRSDEVVAMLQAMQGGKSSVSTIHASSAQDTINRIVSCATTYSSASETWAYRQVGHSVDLIVHIGVTDETQIGGSRLRYVDEIYAPEYGRDNVVSGTPVYQRGPDGRGVPTGEVPGWIGDLRDTFDSTHYLTSKRSTWPRPLPTVRGQASA